MNNYKLALSVDDIRAYINDSKIVAFDFETAPLEQYREEQNAALDAHKSAVVGVSLSVAVGTGVYVPLKHKSGQNANSGAVWEYLREAVFENKSVIAVAHNISFESQFLYALGIIVQEPCYDTIAAAQLTLKSDYEFRSLADSGLKTLVPYLYKVELPTFSEVVGDRFFDELDPSDPETIRYACADSDFTLRLYHTFNAWFDENLPKHRWIVENIESPVAVYTGIMKYNGVGVDVSLMRKKQAEAQIKLDELKAKIAVLIGDVDLGANAATGGFKDFLYKDLGLPVLKTTAKYQEAADDEALQLLSEYCKANRPELVELFDLVTEYRKWGKTKSTYIDGYLNFVNSASSRLHPDLMPLGAASGRFACRKPNLQNSSLNLPVNVREFLVSKEGHSIVELDYSQIEARLAGFLSKDKKLCKIFSDGLDLHAITTAAIYKIPYDTAVDKTQKEYKRRRTTAKTTFFGYLYYIYAKSLNRNLKNAGIESSVDECKAFLANLSSGYDVLSAWQKEQIRFSKGTKYAETLLGRRRYFEHINSIDFIKRGVAERGALNHNVQGLAADLLKLSMVRLLVAVKKYDFIKPILTVHDSLVFEIEDSRIEKSISIIKTIMERPLPISGFEMPIVADVSVGKSYGALVEL